MAIAALVLGIIGLVLSFVPCLGMYAMPLTILACIFGGLGMKNIQGKGMAIAGLVCGIIGTLIAAFWLYSYLTIKQAVDQANKDLDRDMKELKKDIDKQAKDMEKEMNKPTPSGGGGGAMPAECEDLKKEFEKAEKCEKLGDIRSTYKEAAQAVDDSFKSMSGAGPDAMKAMADGCKASADGVREAMKAAGC